MADETVAGRGTGNGEIVYQEKDAGRQLLQKMQQLPEKTYQVEYLATSTPSLAEVKTAGYHVAICSPLDTPQGLGRGYVLRGEASVRPRRPDPPLRDTPLSGGRRPPAQSDTMPGRELVQ
jgi:hypothetical protein